MAAPSSNPTASSSSGPGVADHDVGSPISENGHGLQSKSRNARAQARHRAKRKAYIEHLEASVHNLTDALNDLKQRAAEDPATLRYMALEAENNQLRHEIAQQHQEISHLRAQLGDSSSFRPPLPHQHTLPSTPSDEFGFPRDSKRRKRSEDESYLMASQTPGAMRVDGSGSLPHQMAAGLAQLPYPRYDTLPRHRNNQPTHSTTPSMSAVHTADFPSPHIASLPHGNQFDGPHHRYSLPNSLAPPITTANLPSFANQKSSSESPYNLPFSPNPAAISPTAPGPSYEYRTASSSSSASSPRHRSSPSLLSPTSNGTAAGERVVGGWPAMYAAHPHHHEDAPPISQHVLPPQHSQQYQQHYSTSLHNGGSGGNEAGT